MAVTEKEKDRFKEIMVDVFKAFIKICKDNSLKYYCCGGTAIGVVRHQGVIPWDDDIDILMPRPDYEKFLSLFHTLNLTEFELVTPNFTKNYYLPFAKMCAKNTTLLETTEHACIFGIFIDIFPLDGLPNERLDRLKHMNKFRVLSNKLAIISKPFHVNFKNIFKRLSQMQLRTAMYESILSFNKIKNRKIICQKLDDLANEYSFTSSLVVGNLCGMYGEREFVPKSWFNDIVELPFELLTVNMPKEYHNYLNQIYGNYMALPPVEKQKSEHKHAYLNLDNRKSLGEVFEFIK